MALVDGEPVAATTKRYPETSPREYERSSQVTGRARTSGPTRSATTWTSAPHATRAAAFWAATAPPPTTRQGRPSTTRFTGYCCIIRTAPEASALTRVLLPHPSLLD